MEKKDKMFALVALWKESGLTRKAFTEQQGICMGTFSYWCRKKSDEELNPFKQEGFIELVTGRETVVPLACPVAELEFPGGLRLRIY